MIKKKLSALLISLIAILAFAVPAFADTLIYSRPTTRSAFGYTVSLKSYLGGTSTYYYGGLDITCSPSVHWQPFVSLVLVRNPAEGKIKTSIGRVSPHGNSTYFNLQTPSTSEPFTNTLVVETNTTMYNETFTDSVTNLYTEPLYGGGFYARSARPMIKSNSIGKTYGVLPNLNANQEAPDLIKVDQIGGNDIYVYSNEYYNAINKIKICLMQNMIPTPEMGTLSTYNFEGQPLQTKYVIDYNLSE